MHMNRRSTRQAVTSAAELLTSIDHAQRQSLTSSELVTVMQEARRVADRFAALADTVTAEVDAKKSAEAATSTPLTSLISTTEGRDAGDAAREVFKAQEVSRHEAVRDAALGGDISPQQAQAVAKGIETLPQLPAEVLEKVEQRYVQRAGEIGATPRKLKKLAHVVLAEVAPELMPSHETTQEKLAAQRDRAHRNRFFTYDNDGDGSVSFRGMLPEFEAEPMILMLEAYVVRDRRAAKDRLAALRQAKAGAEEIGAARLTDSGRSVGQRRADALVQMIRRHGRAPRVAGDRPRVVVQMTLEELENRAESAGLVPSGAQLPVGELRRMLCDADLMASLLGGSSEILDEGMSKRTVTPAMRRALARRDKGCVFPGCNAHHTYCEAHHIVPWYRRGPTAMHNLVLLCPYHHSLVEPDRYARREQWTVVMDPSTQMPRVVPPKNQQVFEREARSRGPG